MKSLVGLDISASPLPPSSIKAYNKLWASVMKAVPKLDESESGQMVLK